MIVNRTGLAEVLGVSLPTIDNRVRRGLPFLVKGAPGIEWEFETAEVLKWHVEQAEEALREQLTTNTPDEDSTSNNAKELSRRKLQAETEIVEIELLKKKGEVVLVEDVVAEMADAVASLRSQILNLPRRVAPLILGETDEDTVKEILVREVDELLHELHEKTSREADDLS